MERLLGLRWAVTPLSDATWNSPILCVARFRPNVLDMYWRPWEQGLISTAGRSTRLGDWLGHPSCVGEGLRDLRYHMSVSILEVMPSWAEPFSDSEKGLDSATQTTRTNCEFAIFTPTQQNGPTAMPAEILCYKVAFVLKFRWNKRGGTSKGGKAHLLPHPITPDCQTGFCYKLS